MSATETANRLSAYRAAELKILGGQTVSGMGRTLTRADLATVQATIAKLEAQLSRELAAQAQGRRRQFGSSLSNFNVPDVRPDGAADLHDLCDDHFHRC